MAAGRRARVRRLRMVGLGVAGLLVVMLAAPLITSDAVAASLGFQEGSGGYTGTQDTYLDESLPLSPDSDLGL